MTKTKTTLADRLQECERAAQAEVEAARARYVRIVVAEASGAGASAEDLDRLPEDLKVLHATPPELQRDIARLTELRALSDDDSDPAVLARERQAEAREQSRAADAEVVEAKRALQAAEQKASAERLRVLAAGDAIDAAGAAKRRRSARAAELREALVARGLPSAMLPPPPGSEPPPRKVRVRAREKAFVAGRIVEQGEVLELPEDRVGGEVLVPVGADVPAKPVYDRNNPPPWSTPGWLKQQGLELPEVEDQEPNP